MKDDNKNFPLIAVGLVFGVGMALALNNWLLGIMFGIIFFVGMKANKKPLENQK